jgi:hypothetical protein
VDLAEIAGAHAGDQGRPVGVEAPMEADLEGDPGVPGGLHGRQRSLPVERDRLLAEHVLAGPGGRGDQLGVGPGPG